MGAGVGHPRDAASQPRTIPTTGMRGGLGRTLLTAFLILTILPVTFTGVYAVRQSSRNIAQQGEAKLQAIASLKREAFQDRILDIQAYIASTLAVAEITPELDNPDVPARFAQWWQTAGQHSDIMGAVVYDQASQILWDTGGCAVDVSALGVDTSADYAFSWSPSGDSPLIVNSNAQRTFVACLDPQSMQSMLTVDASLGNTTLVSLVYDGQIRFADAQQLPDEFTVSSTSMSSFVRYEDRNGDIVIGIYAPVPDLNAGLLVEQHENELVQSTEHFAATLIAMALGIALVTTVISAVVIRRITRPVIRLTESAVAMSEGDLDQHLQVKSSDEIGILTHVFNEMAAELKSLYDDLESKVVERTQRLQQVNYQLQRRALHLQASQEVSHAITSVREPTMLLNQVTELIRARFVYSSVAIYLVEPGGGIARLVAASPDPASARTSDADAYRLWEPRYSLGDGSIVDGAIRKGETQLKTESLSRDSDWFAHSLSRIAVPLRMENRIVGAMAVLSSSATEEGVQPEELEVLSLVANQVTVALENARVYEREREAMEQLEAAEAFKVRFLSNMSHELRDPLNTVIGFSHLLIKGIEGPLSTQQVEDVQQIHNASQQLLLLVNDILSISQLQAGLVELRQQSMDVIDVVAGLLPTANALVKGKDIKLKHEIAPDLPLIYADPAHLRQILVHLLNNAAKYTHEGEIIISAWRNEENVYISVRDTGIGIPEADRERIFTQFEKGSDRGTGAGLGLALCKEFVGMHGGRIWVDSEVGQGSTFTFSMPVFVGEVERENSTVDRAKQDISNS